MLEKITWKTIFWVLSFKVDNFSSMVDINIMRCKIYCILAYNPKIIRVEKFQLVSIFFWKFNLFLLFNIHNFNYNSKNQILKFQNLYMQVQMWSFFKNYIYNFEIDEIRSILIYIYFFWILLKFLYFLTLINQIHNFKTQLNS